VKRRLAACALVVSLAAPGTASALVTPASTAPPAQRLALVLPLKVDSTGLAGLAEQVTTPGSPLYQRYRSIAWISRRFGASARERALALGYLRRHGATDVHIDATGLFADASLNVAQAQTIFGTSLSAPHAGHAHFTRPATAVKIPRKLRGVVTGVVGLDTQASFSTPALVAAPRDTDTTTTSTTTTGTTTTTCGTGSGGTGIGGTTTGSCATGNSSGYSGPNGAPQGCTAGLATDGFAPNEYLDAYQYQSLHAANVRGQGERVALVEIDGFSTADINRFAACFNLQVPPIKAVGVGLQRLLPPGGEATLDLEVLDAAASRLKSIYVYEAKPDAAHVLQALTAPLKSSGDKPDVISVSLGLCESDTVAAVGRAGVAATESVLEEAGAAGISVLGATGDGGSAGCVANSGTDNTPLPELAVTYPASSPWITAVGGTNFDLSTLNQISSQVVWNDGSAQPGLAGGGGFSTLFARPKYQNGVVSQNARALPDVSLLADVAPGYDVYCAAEADCDERGWTTFGGTSAATPLLAGGFALVDQLLREHSLQPLGLANALLYKLALHPPSGDSIVYDVTQGSNDVGPFIQSSGAALGCCTAAAGFDEASGWGGIDLAQFALDAESAQAALANVTLRVASDQHPFATRGIKAKVHCSASCDVSVRAKVVIRHRTPFTDYSKLVYIRAGTTATVTIGFTPAQMTNLAPVITDETTASAGVTAALVDPSGNIERQTPTVSLPISS
jgi:subtilase family serine protease